MVMLCWKVPETLGEGHQLEEVDHGSHRLYLVLSCPVMSGLCHILLLSWSTLPQLEAMESDCRLKT